MRRAIIALSCVLFPSVVRADPPDFDRQVAPLLAARCLDCHHGPKPKGDLDLSRKAAVLGGNAPIVVPGKPADSPLWERIAADEMPPKKPLTDAEKKLLKDWIEGGATWGADPLDPFRFTTSSRAGYDWWALQPVKRPAIPASRDREGAAWVRNPIDAFILAKLSDKGLSLSPPADKRTLIRRVHYDLIGLPPTPEEVAAFLKDDAPDAFEKVVEKLLASPHYGERWARHWLDVVRFGETDGFERNSTRPNAWHYRDWVIRALNADLPYDEFARLQLAGDVLRPDDPDAVKATGFLVAAVHNTVLGNDQMRAVARQDELEDLVGSVGQTFLGLTVNCARCHDHKFDPIAQADFYRLAAALAGSAHGERDVIGSKPNAEIARLTADLEQARKELAAIEEPARNAALADRGKKGGGAVPSPLAAWDFRTGSDDLNGKLHAKLIGGAKLTPDGAVLDGKTGFLRTPPLPTDLRAKTLEAWVKLDGFTQHGGGAMSVQTPDGGEFDGIVFGERDPARWFVGSDGFRRSKSFDPPEEKEMKAVHVAISYTEDGTVTGYREGKPALTGYPSKGPIAFKAGAAVVAFGCRHEPAGGDKMLAGTVVAARLYDRALSLEEVAASFAAGPGFVGEAEVEAKLTPEQRMKRRELKTRQTTLAADLVRLRRAATAKVYAVTPQPSPGITRLLLRGQLETPADVVAPAGLVAVGGVKPDFGLAPDSSDDARRKKLAEWITSPANPLFARVIVNRVWHYHFGTGLVETPNDFGFNGSRPSHPELLDWLASELVQPTWRAGERKFPGGTAVSSGELPFPGSPWSLKRLHRLIVTSQTYRQSSGMQNAECGIGNGKPLPLAAGAVLGSVAFIPHSAFRIPHLVDADNRLLWRKKPQRLEGEAVRDTMLAVSGLLNPAVGGKGFSDYRERNFNGTAYYDPFDPAGPEFHRRSIYRFVPRGANQGLLDTFDCPDPAAAAPRRTVTTTPLQALALWNNGFALRTAGAFADRVAKESADTATQVTRAWQLAFQRDPTTEERQLAEKLVADHWLKALCRALFNANEFITVE